MAVGIVADERAVLQPDDALGTQPQLQALFYVVLRQRLVAVGGQQAAGGGEDGASAVALDGAAFEHEVQMVFVASLDEAAVVDLATDAVVEFSLELLAPAVEAEVEEDEV